MTLKYHFMYTDELTVLSCYSFLSMLLETADIIIYSSRTQIVYDFSASLRVQLNVAFTNLFIVAILLGPHSRNLVFYDSV
jgi:hypothetical protein